MKQVWRSPSMHLLGSQWLMVRAHLSRRSRLVLVLLFLVPPVVSALGAAWLARGWTIDRAAQARIIAELHGR